MKRLTEPPPFNVWRSENRPIAETRNGEFVSLVRAVTEVGQFLFGNAWTDEEPLSDDEVARERFTEVQEWIGKAIASKKIPFVLISPDGKSRLLSRESDPWAFPSFGASDWDAADLTDLFRTCQMRLHPSRCPEQPIVPFWIFVRRQELSRLTATVGEEEMGKPPAPDDLERWFKTEVLKPWTESGTRANWRPTFARMKLRFPTIRQSQFKAVWNALRPPSWSKRGPNTLNKDDGP